MKILLAALALLVAMNAAPALAKGGGGDKGAKKGTTAPAVDPNIAAAKAHGGKVWILTSTPPNSEGDELAKWLSSHPSATEVSKKPSEERWSINYLAVFKKPPAKGPLTIEFVDKKEPGTLVAQDSSQAPGGSLVFQEPYDLDANNGFNKGHTYVMKVGQLIKGRFQTYATAEIALK
jgi:hypothetical protein